MNVRVPAASTLCVCSANTLAGWLAGCNKSRDAVLPHVLYSEFHVCIIQSCTVPRRAMMSYRTVFV
jgi:hypothetical protein